MFAIIRTRWHTRPLSRRAKRRSSAARFAAKKYAGIVIPQTWYACLSTLPHLEIIESRYKFQTECNSLTETCRIAGHRGSLDLDPMDQRVRGKLLHHVFREIIPYTRNRHATNEEVLEAIKAGTFTFLFDQHGKFITE
jgi:hypothetical protein